jgi:hypothetical protein
VAVLALLGIALYVAALWYAERPLPIRGTSACWTIAAALACITGFPRLVSLAQCGCLCVLRGSGCLDIHPYWVLSLGAACKLQPQARVASEVGRENRGAKPDQDPVDEVRRQIWQLFENGYLDDEHATLALLMLDLIARRFTNPQIAETLVITQERPPIIWPTSSVGSAFGRAHRLPCGYSRLGSYRPTLWRTQGICVRIA